jgi:hypothetical protein
MKIDDPDTAFLVDKPFKSTINRPSCKQKLSEFHRMLEQGPYGLLQKVGKI